MGQRRIFFFPFRLDMIAIRKIREEVKGVPRVFAMGDNCGIFKVCALTAPECNAFFFS